MIAVRTQQQLDRIKNRAIEARKAAPPRKGSGLIRSIASIPPELYYNARAHGEDPRDPDLMKFELKHNPWMRPPVEGRIFSTLQHLTPAPGGPAKVRTRFGVASFHKAYA